MNAPTFTAATSLYPTRSRYQLTAVWAVGDNLEAPRTVATLVRAVPLKRGAGDSGSRTAALGISLPIYGNHCGPGHGNPNTSWIDAVDQACYTHDRCYEQRGYFDCQCDRNLIAGMPAAIASAGTAAAAVAGTAIATFFANTPCLCRVRTCLPFIGCLTVTIPGRGGSGVC